MKKKANIDGNLICLLKIRMFKSVLFRLSLLSIIFILSEIVHAQDCSVILKINDPTPVCSPATINLTSDAITDGSTSGLTFSYYLNPELTILVPSPANVSAGIYYIKGALTGSRTAWVASSVKVIVTEMPNVVITPSILKSPNENVDLTSLHIKAGSDEGLIFSYWYDIEATKQLLLPKSTGKGMYFIKGTSVNGCSDIKAVTVIE